jgi:beta-galactosidase
VNLVVTDPLHVTWYGTFVTTPTLAANTGASSTVNLKTELRNDRTTGASCTLRTDIQDASGTVVATVTSTQTIAAGTTVTFDQTTPAVSSPSLWHPDHPTLYRAVSIVSDGTGEVDRFTTPFGFRYLSWSASNGFSLNGSRYYFHGANVHQDHAGWGDAVADSAAARDVKMVKDAGFNFIRGSHYPHSPAFTDACDQVGVLYWSENPFWGSAAYGEGTWDTAGAYPSNSSDQAPFESSVLTSLTEMIRIHRNHPSIIAWSMSNEPYFTAGSTISQMRGLLTKEVNLEHQLDPTRPAGIGGCQRPTDSTRIDLLGDVAGYNGDGASINIFQNPGVPSVVTEYGSTTADRPGNYDPGWGTSFQFSNGIPVEPTWRAGQALWCMFDHGTIKGSSLGKMGIVDYFRVPKRGWYWYRNAYAHVAPPTWPSSGTPAGLKLTASDTTLSAVDGTKDSLLTVTVVDSSGKPINNNVPVTLTVTSGPGEFPTGPSITFRPPSTDPQSDIQIRDGVAAIEFRSYSSGTSVITATSSGLQSSTVTITSQGSPAYVPGVTPPAPTRTYTRFSGGTPPQTTLTVALNRPTSASSTATSTTSAAANDGNTSTAWLASSTDSSAWWRVFLEGSFSVNTLEVTFPTAGNYRYTIAVSSDGSTWTTAVDQSQTTSTAQTQRATGNFGSSIQYVRVNFVGLPAGQAAGIAELVVGGTSAGASYTLNVTGTGNGTITGGGLSCGSLCNAVYVSGTSVVLTATPDSGSSFLGWGGACSGSSPTCTVSMTAAQSVTATFSSGPPTSYPLTVTKAGTGSGTVSGGQIACGTTCTANIDIGASVTLTAVPDAASSSTFVSWSGACTGSSPTCTVTMNAAQAVTATFNAPPGTVSINVGGDLAGNFVADVDFSGGSTYSNSNTIDTSLLAGAVPPQQVFQTERYGEFTYAIPGFTPGSACSVALYFEESYLTATGLRLFDVSINGAKVLTGFDIYAAAGAGNKAVATTFTTTADASGQVVIQFTKGSVENPKVCGIVVAPISASLVDIDPPSAPANFTWTSDGLTVSLTWSASTDNVGVVGYELFYGNFDLGTFTDTVLSLIGFKAGTPYAFTVKARDAAGNVSAASNQITVLLGAGQDTSPPSAPTNLAASSVTASACVLRWTASTDDVGVVVYQIYSGAVVVGTAVGSTSATISNLTPNNTYVFTATARDAAGNVSPASNAVSVTTGNTTLTLTLTITAGSGGTTNPAPGTYSYSPGATVNVTANPAANYAFAGWSGAATGTSSPAAVTMNGNQTLTASFTAAAQSVSIDVGGAAAGSFLADAYFSGGSTYSTTNAIDTALLTSGTVPPQAVLQSERFGEFTYTIPNLAAGAPYSATLYFEESYVTAAGQRLFDVAISGTKVLSAFDIYLVAGGQNEAIAQSFNTTADANGQVVIQFTKGAVENPKVCAITIAPGSVPTHYITIATTVGGATSPAAGTYTYPAGTAVVLTAIPATGYTFTGWSYATSVTTNPVVLMMNDNLLVTANFAPVQTKSTLTISATGNGTTSPAPGTYSYDPGTTVTVTALPASGATFTGWSGAASGTTSPITLVMNGATTLTAAFSGGSQIQACPSLSGAPSPTSPVPSAAQAAYQRSEMTAFIHYSMATYDGSEQGNPSDSPSLFNPSNLNATTVNQWVSSLKDAGFRQAMLVTKHSVGFCLWPSKYTSYSVKSSPWMNGTGDVVQLFTDAMRNAGMRTAIYLSPWDQKYPSSSSGYETYYKNQVAELLNYGPAYEFEFDGFNAPTSNVNFKSVFQQIKQAQPNVLLWAGPEIVNTGAIPDLQWIGNENGQATRTTSSLDTKNCGGGSNWCPFECNVSSHRPNWFWHPNSSPISLSDMQSIYFATVGMNCTLNFNVPPSQTGAFDSKDLSLLQQFGGWYSALYQTNLLKGQPVTADSTWASAGFDASKAVDDDVCSYWAAGSGKTTGRLEVTPASPITASLISIREAIELGERVKTYHVEIKQNGTWNKVPTDTSGTKIAGTVIGQRQLWQVSASNVQAVALVIDSAKDAPAIAEFSVY